MLLPFLVSNVIAAMIWFWLLDPVLGFGNTLLTAAGLDRQAFLSDTALALPSLAVINIWRHVGFNALLFYTGLQSIPRHLYEAASLEGAGRWCVFQRVTLPLLRPILVFVLVTSVIGSFQIFDTIAVTTQGGPGFATETLMWYVYQSAFGSFRMGYASAMSVVLFAGLMAVTAVQMRVLRADHSDLS
jgi:multiple sugar transport system permease protein